MDNEFNTSKAMENEHKFNINNMIGSKKDLLKLENTEQVSILYLLIFLLVSNSQIHIRIVVNSNIICFTYKIKNLIEFAMNIVWLPDQYRFEIRLI